MAAFFFSRRDYSSEMTGVKERRKQFWSIYIGVAIADT